MILGSHSFGVCFWFGLVCFFSAAMGFSSRYINNIKNEIKVLIRNHRSNCFQSLDKFSVLGFLGVFFFFFLSFFSWYSHISNSLQLPNLVQSQNNIKDIKSIHIQYSCFCLNRKELMVLTVEKLSSWPNVE